MKHSPTVLVSLAIAAFLVLLAAPAAAERTDATFRSSDEFSRPQRIAAAQRSGDLVSTQEAVTVSLWDGTAEAGYRFVETVQGENAEFTQLVNFGTPGVVNEVVYCFFFDQPVSDFAFSVLIHRNNSGTPGSVILDEEFVLSGPPASGDECIRAVVDQPITAPRVFVGVRFPEVGETFLGVDTDGPNTSPGFARVSPADPWQELPFDSFTGYRNLAMDVEFTEAGDPPPPPATCPAVACVEDSETLCLQNDRFSVKATFRNAFEATGAMNAGPEITPDTGYLHFPGDPTNVEVVLKVLNACGVLPPLSPRFWVFAGGLTDQQIDLEVCDTLTGTLKRYSNQLGTRFSPITDIDAFATCS